MQIVYIILIKQEIVRVMIDFEFELFEIKSETNFSPLIDLEKENFLVTSSFILNIVSPIEKIQTIKKLLMKIDHQMLCHCQVIDQYYRESH